MNLITGCYFFAAVPVYKLHCQNVYCAMMKENRGKDIFMNCRGKFYTTHTIAVDICICQHSIASSLILNLILLLEK